MPRLRTWHLGVGLFALTVAAFAPVRHNGFVDFDDEVYITHNPEVLNGLHGSGFRWAWTTFHANYYQPLTWLSLQFDAQFFSTASPGGAPLPGAAAVHIHSLLWHAASVLVLFALCLRLSSCRWRSFFVAALFAVHPLRVESVAWAAERKDVLSVFFGLVALWAYARYAERPGVGRYLGVLGALLLSLLAKPMLITLPFVLLLLDFWPLRRAPRLALLLEKVPLFALAAGIAVLTVVARRQNHAPVSLDAISLQDRLANAVLGYNWYLFTTFWPVRLGAYYPHPEHAWTVLSVGAGAGLLLILTVLAFAQARRRPWLLVGWLWFGITLLPVIGLAQGGNQAWADRFSYFPQIGLLLAVVWGLAEGAARRRVPELAVGTAGVLVLGCLGALTWLQVGTWRDTPTLWKNVLAVTRDNPRAHVNLGKYYLETGQLDEAETHLAEAVRLRPDSFEFRHFHGCALLALGRLDEAAGRFLSVLAESANYVDAWHNLATVRLRQGDAQRALNCFRRALALQPDAPDTLSASGLALWRLGQRRQAVEAFQAALKRNPTDAEAWHGLGLASLSEGDPGKAVIPLEKALQFSPRMVKAAGNLGLALGRLGYWDQAATHLANAVKWQDLGEDWLTRMKGRVVELESTRQAVILRGHLGYALFRASRRQDAADVYRQALRLDPHWPQRFTARAWRLATTRDVNTRDPQLAFELASQALQATDSPSASLLDTLAAAQAALGRYEEAARTARQALAQLSTTNADANLAQAIRAHLERYQQGQSVQQ
jgi:tetratricopeptide (TPR) repeat protein